MSESKMRVVHCVSSDRFAGVERYITYVAPELERRGWDVRVVGGHPDRMRAELGSIEFAPAATPRGVTAQLFRFGPRDVVHAHMTAAEGAAVVASMLRPFSLVATRHFAEPRGSSLLGRLAAPAIVRAVDRQIAISRFVADSIGQPSTVILNGVPKNNRARAPERIVLVAQRLESEKCTEVAIDAWAWSRLRHDGWRLTVAGSGGQLAELTRRVDKLCLQESVDFVGVQSDMGPLLSRAGIFLATAPAEPFGLAVVEAMAAGVPVVAACGGGHIETVGEVSKRWLFPSGDSHVAGEMLDSLGEDVGERLRAGAALQGWQRQHLSIEVHVDRLERVYRGLRA